MDDLVDYSEPYFSVVPKGVESIYGIYYDYDMNSKEGKLYKGYLLNKDTGILTFSNNNTYPQPLGRIFGDYMHHTYYRLTSDGYGDLYFNGSGILVPSKSQNSYTDWTYVDLKIVNEGLNTITEGTLQFLARGYITKGTVVDTVLDNNRPWDVQQGTTAETVQRTGACYSNDYSKLKEANRSNAYDSIINNGQSCNFGTL
jgi:hypothetical protein